jgi:hypothetical protein
MGTLPELPPDPDLLLQRDASDIAPILLCLARERIQNGMLNRDILTASPLIQAPQYSHDKQQRVEISVSLANLQRVERPRPIRRAASVLLIDSFSERLI